MSIWDRAMIMEIRNCEVSIRAHHLSYTRQQPRGSMSVLVSLNDRALINITNRKFCCARNPPISAVFGHVNVQCRHCCAEINCSNLEKISTFSAHWCLGGAHSARTELSTNASGAPAAQFASSECNYGSKRTTLTYPGSVKYPECAVYKVSVRTTSLRICIVHYQCTEHFRVYCKCSAV